MNVFLSLKDKKTARNYGLSFAGTRVVVSRRSQNRDSRISAIVHFAIVCLVIWPLSGSEAGVDLVLITSPNLTLLTLLFLCKYKLVSMITT